MHLCLNWSINIELSYLSNDLRLFILFHQGLNLAFKKAAVGGSFSLTKGITKAATKSLVAKTRTVSGFTKKAALDVPDGVDWSAGLMKTAAYSIIPIKILTSFAQRGIKGGEFAEFFYKVFNPQQVFYSDIIGALLGAQIAASKVAPGDTGDNGGFTGETNIHSDFTTTEPNSPASLNAGWLDDLVQDSINQPGELSRSNNESFVYKNSIVDFLFENKVVVKSNINVSVVNEDFGLFKSEFKKLFK